MAQDEGELIRLALEQLPDGVVVADAHDHVVTLNAQARLIRGLRSDAGIAFPLLFGSSVTEDVEQGLGALRTGTATEFSVVEGDPSTGRVYEHRCVPVKTPGGTYAGIAVTSHDVTDRQLQDNRQEARVRGLQQQVASLQDALPERFVGGMITLVDALEARDRYTRGHSSRVAFMAGEIARRVLGHAADVAEIELAARLHDIGKVAVPDRLLDKPSSLLWKKWRSWTRTLWSVRASCAPSHSCAMLRSLSAITMSDGMEPAIQMVCRENTFRSVLGFWLSPIHSMQ